MKIEAKLKVIGGCWVINVELTSLAQSLKFIYLADLGLGMILPSLFGICIRNETEA